MAPTRVALSIIVSFGGALLAPLLQYIGLSLAFPPTVIGLILLGLVPGVLCRAFSPASISSIAGALAGVIVWLMVIFQPVGDGLVRFVSANLQVDPVLTYILLLVVMAPVAGLVGLAASPPTEEGVIKAALEQGEVAEAEAPKEGAGAVAGVEAAEERVEEAEAAETVRAEAEEAVAVEEVVYVKCGFCGEPVPEEAVFCPNCGRRVRP